MVALGRKRRSTAEENQEVLLDRAKVNMEKNIEMFIEKFNII